jgi:hypothetical protein
MQRSKEIAFDAIRFGSLLHRMPHTGAAKKMTWSTVSKDCSEIELPGEIVKNDDPLALPLAGPLEPAQKDAQDLS